MGGAAMPFLATQKTGTCRTGDGVPRGVPSPTNTGIHSRPEELAKVNRILEQKQSVKKIVRAKGTDLDFRGH
jgi:hypothetical protein